MHQGTWEHVEYSEGITSVSFEIEELNSYSPQ